MKVREPEGGLATEALADQRKQEFRAHETGNLKTERVRSRNNKVLFAQTTLSLTSVRSTRWDITALGLSPTVWGSHWTNYLLTYKPKGSGIIPKFLWWNTVELLSYQVCSFWVQSKDLNMHQGFLDTSPGQCLSSKEMSYTSEFASVTKVPCHR